jgi:pimeloyl-ACP methyl ester carboxylesterase
MKEFSREIGPKKLAADIAVPDAAQGVVLFAHGSGSSRFSSRNRRVAADLNGSGFATVLFDLLSEEEASDRRNVFDIPLLGERMSQAVAFAQIDSELRDLPIGLFGASTGAAAALVAAAERGASIGAIVSRGGRPDLALPLLGRVKAPTLLIVGGHDEPVITMNETALAALACEKRLEIVPGATHLFEEAGTLERVIELATRWFKQHLRRRQAP